jgi:hypothetical protein
MALRAEKGVLKLVRYYFEIESRGWKSRVHADLMFLCTVAISAYK